MSLLLLLLLLPLSSSVAAAVDGPATMDHTCHLRPSPFHPRHTVDHVGSRLPKEDHMRHHMVLPTVAGVARRTIHRLRHMLPAHIRLRLLAAAAAAPAGELDRSCSLVEGCYSHRRREVAVEEGIDCMDRTSSFLLSFSSSSSLNSLGGEG